MVFKWVQSILGPWGLFIVPEGTQDDFISTANVAVASEHKETETWSGVVYSTEYSATICFYGIATLEEIKSLIETTVALR